ncbi:hypothetical protein NHQ30_006790 [Ciborinia camelliae]|nr:hypothetical protein NHQ30_006790 [Ciborinia camelliae]
MALVPPERRDTRSSMFLDTPRRTARYDGPEVPQISRVKTLAHNKLFDRKATYRDQNPSGRSPNAPTGPANGIPSLKLHPFHNCDNTEGEISVEVAVLFMHGGDEDRSQCSIFSTKGTEQYSGSPNIAVGQADQLSEINLDRGQKEIFQAKISGMLESQAKKDPTDAQKQRTARFDNKLLQSSGKHIEKTESPSIPLHPKAEPKEVNWLKQDDMLPSLLPEGRVMGYGFDLGALSYKIDFKAAASIFAKEFNRIRGCFHKPIVLIGHGYGNIVIETLLCSSDEESKAFKRLTTAVILFAPPTSGSAELNNWSTDKMNLPKSASEKAFVGLGKNSEELKNIWEEFRSLASRLDPYICMYLPKQYNIDSKVNTKDISDEPARDTAADPQHDSFDVVQTSSGFGDIASFSSTKDKTFLKLASQIVRSIQVWQLLDATLRGDGTLLRGLIRRSVNINLAGKTGKTSLLLSAQRKDPALMKILLGERQLDIDHQNNQGDTALHLAVTNNASQDTKREMILSLLRAGANPEIRNHDKKKPKQLVSKSDIGIKNIFTKDRPLVEGPLIQPRKRLEKSIPPGREGIKACQSVEMFVTEMYYTKDSKTLVPERHWTMYKTVYDLIYAQRPGSVESMLDSERSKNIQESEKPHCRWYHIPENNVSGRFSLS